MYYSSNFHIYKMIYFPPTIILRHRKENLKKCSLSGLETREDMRFFTYPQAELPDLSSYVLLTIEAPSLSEEDASSGLFLIDGTWRYAAKMFAHLPLPHRFQCRSIPSHYRTAYPRVQTECAEPERGLASLEALFIAYYLMGRNTDGLLDRYHWKREFLEKNSIPYVRTHSSLR